MSMEDDRTTREALEQFVDELMKRKPTTATSPEEIRTQREQMIGELEDQISRAVINSMDDAQFAEYEKMLDDEATTAEQCADFLRGSGIDMQSVVREAAAGFGRDFLGGENV